MKLTLIHEIFKSALAFFSFCFSFTDFQLETVSKTSEYLKDYSFVLPNGKKVTFQLKEASTEQNNNKALGDGERRFAIYKENPLEVDGNNLTINFTYELHKKSVKQDALMKEAFETISSNLPVDFAEICASGSAPTEKNKNRTLLEKHLNDYVSRNTFDYFIHKDLGGFLRRECRWTLGE